MVGVAAVERAALPPGVEADEGESRMIDTLASGGKRVLTALRQARAQVREDVWTRAGDAAPDAGGQVVVHMDGLLVIAHSEKQDIHVPAQ